MVVAEKMDKGCSDMTLTMIAAVIAALLGGAFGWLLTQQTFTRKMAALEHDHELAEDELAATKNCCVSRKPKPTRRARKSISGISTSAPCASKLAI
jgi:membrane protein YqaA with SNARE-associated domain